jgi:signal transduction histidine kinase
MASLGMMISGVTHEINNPNNFISFNLPILRDYLEALLPLLDEKAAIDPELELCNMPVTEFRQDLLKLIDNLSHGSQRINAIVSRLKDFARIRDSQKLKPVSIRQVAERAVTMAHYEIRRHLKTCVLEIPDGLPRLRSDDQAIEQILVNLLLNACQAADKPDAWVRLTAAMDEETDWLMRISLSDNGCGMDADTQRHIFDPLSTTNGGRSGTGLGLSIVHNLVESLEGRIEVESLPGEGSSFHIFLPDTQPKSEDVSPSPVQNEGDR